MLATKEIFYLFFYRRNIIRDINRLKVKGEETVAIQTRAKERSSGHIIIRQSKL